MNGIQKKRANYLGTKINHQWWRRYTKGGFFTRGFGEYWIKDGSLFFQHQARQKPIGLPLCCLTEIEVCPCHKRTGGVPVIKLVWQRDGNWLSSSFALFSNKDEISGLLANLRSQAA